MSAANRTPPYVLRRLAKNLGGECVRMVTRYDHERGGRVVELTIIFPGTLGYEQIEESRDC